ncbi:MAG: cyclic pyranopterin monophosphate synthase MoaC [Firmicutes bacterium]|nr:cyclic pyranopterin monophosphate synthase MoaC [Bacillota bacterium]
MTPVIINLVAAQADTGKTTVIEKLLPELKARGFRVAALKGNLHHRDLDLPGKDSWRYARAGAEVAGFTTLEGFLLHGITEQNCSDAVVATLLRDLDLILIEGNKKSSNPKIEIVRNAINPKPLLPAGTVAIFSDLKILDSELPLIDLNNPEAQADFIVGRFLPGGMTSLMNEKNLTHFDHSGRPRMVDVSAKEQSLREAYACGEITMAAETLELVKGGRMAKGDVLAVAQVAAVMAVKETGRLIPMAHPLGISGVEVDFKLTAEPEPKIEIGVWVKLTGQTGVEMEALTGVSIAALTIYDMCKAVDKNMVIKNIRLMQKKGGRSGHYRREQS